MKFLPKLLCSASLLLSTQWTAIAQTNSYRLYGIDVFADEIVLINPTNGRTTFFADLPFDANEYTGFDYKPDDGKLYVSVVQSNGIVFYSIDPVSGTVNLTSKILSGLLPGPSSLGFTSTGDFYGYGERAAFSLGDFMFVNWNTMQAVIRPQNSGTPSVLGGDFDEVRGVFWITDEYNGKVYQLNPATGANIWTSSSAWPGDQNGNLSDVDVAPSGEVFTVAYVYPSSGIESYLLSINSSSGNWTQVRLDRAGVNGLASAPSPTKQLFNGSFEASAYMPSNTNTLNPALDGWSGSGNFQVITNGLNYGPAQHGTKALVFNAGETTPAGSIHQGVAVEASSTYQLTFYLRHDGIDSDTRPGTVGIKAELLQNGSVIAESSIYLNTANGYTIGQWYRFALQAPSTASTMTVRFTDISTSGALRKDISLDTISLTPFDTDADGVNDFREGKDGTDPNDAASFNPLSKDLLAYYIFDTDLADESGYERDLNQISNVQQIADIRSSLGQSLRLPSSTGSDARSSVTSGLSGNMPRSVSFWFYSDGPQPWPSGNIVMVAGDAASTGPTSRVAIDRGEGTIQIDNGSGREARTVSVPNLHQRVHHFVWTYQDNLTNSKFYLNGKPLAAGAIDNATLDGLGTHPVRIGDLNDRGFVGKLDDLRVYKRVLTPAEVQQIYTLEAQKLDTDQDGLIDVVEFKLEDMGFDRYAAQTPTKVQSIFSNPNLAGLYTQTEFDSNYNTGRGRGRQDVTDNPGAYGLYSETSIMDVNLGGVMVRKLGNSVNLEVQVQATPDLMTQSFTNLPYRHLLYLDGLPSNKAFMRIRALGPQ